MINHMDATYCEHAVHILRFGEYSYQCNWRGYHFLVVSDTHTWYPIGAPGFAEIYDLKHFPEPLIQAIDLYLKQDNFAQLTLPEFLDKMVEL